MELESPAAAKKAVSRLGVCHDSRQGDFGISSVPGATGRRCEGPSGKSVQEALFTRGPLFFKVKLEQIKEPESTAEIVEMVGMQAEKAG
jgi:hypothetical protein